MRAELNIPDTLGAYALDAALEGLVQLGVADLSTWGMHGDPLPPLYMAGVRYEREQGTERWLLPSQVAACGVGDCEDLAAWRAAELRCSGEDPTARAIVVRSGPRTWHAVVERGDGGIEDPSRVLGMEHDVLGSLADWALVVEPRNGAWVVRMSRGDSGVYARAPYADDALNHAAVLGIAAGEMGIIPGLDILARVAQGALQSIIPGATPGATPTTSTPQRTPTTAITIPRLTSTTSTTSTTSDDVDVARLASQLDRLVRRETARKVSAAQRAAARALR